MAASDTQIVWFKRDLRCVDHAALRAAADHGPVAPVFIIEPEYWHLPDVSARQYDFVCESLLDLAAACAAAGSPLRVERGVVVEILADLVEETGSRTLWSHEETGNAWTFERDRAVASWAAGAGVKWHELPESAVIRGLRRRRNWSAHWARRMRASITEAPILQTPAGWNGRLQCPDARELGLKPDPCPERQSGGRKQGMATLADFLETRGEPYRIAMSSPAAGARHCSRLSPHLAWGTLSLREVTQAGWQRQSRLAALPQTGRWPGAMKSFLSRLAWRDHFIQKLESEPELEFRAMLPGLDRLRGGSSDAVKLAAWSSGETGYPFVDACMRALRTTGWMNFRMRAMLTSFASYQLWIPWQDSGKILARFFTDYEAGIHWPQVQMQSGVTGINAVRIYNPVKQGLDQDPTGVFVRQYVPELEPVPDRFVHQPWLWPEAGQVLGRAYPEPIVDLDRATRAARDRIFEARRQPEVREQKQAILDRHAIRRSMRRSRRKAPGPSSQLRLDL